MNANGTKDKVRIKLRIIRSCKDEGGWWGRMKVGVGSQHFARSTTSGEPSLSRCVASVDK